VGLQGPTDDVSSRNCREICSGFLLFRYSKCQPFMTVLYVSKNDQFSKLICKLTWLSATGLVDEFIDVVAKFIRL